MSGNFTPLAVPIVFVGFVFCSASMAADEWGDLTGTIVLRGAPPELPELDPGTDAFCCKAEPKNESLVLGEQQQIANVVVYVRPKRGEPLAVHEGYQAVRNEPVELDNEGCAFTPHVVLVQTEQPLLLKNTDAVNHSVKSELGDESFNFMLTAKGTQELSFETPQRAPRPVACSIHPFMQGWLLVRDDPYMATTDAEGKFLIAKLPAGEHELQFWHELPGYLKNCQSDQVQLDRRGRVKVTIEPDTVTDLGTIVVDAELMASEGS